MSTQQERKDFDRLIVKRRDMLQKGEVEIEILSKALEIAVEDISDMDRGAIYKTSAYISAAKRRLSGDYVSYEEKEKV